MTLTKKDVPARRRLKIYTRYRHRRGRDSYTVPELRLSGIWLALAGFISDSYVEVEVSKDQLIIHLTQTPV